MTWDILASIISMATIGIAVGKVIYNLSKTLTKLSCSVDSLNTTLNNLTSDNQREHEELFGDVEYIKTELNSYDKRLDRLEEKP